MVQKIGFFKINFFYYNKKKLNITLLSYINKKNILFFITENRERRCDLIKEQTCTERRSIF